LSTKAEQRVKMFRDRLDKAQRNQRTHALDWRRWEDVYLGVQPIDPGGGKLLSSKLKVRWAKQRWNAIAPELMDPEPKLYFRPVEISDIRLSDCLKQLTRVQFNQDHFVSKQPASVHDAGIYGLAVFKVHWHQKEKTLKVRDTKSILDRLMKNGNSFTVKKVITENRPAAMYVDPFDFFWDPAATSDQNWRYVFHRTYMTKGEMKQWQKKGVFRNVDKACAEADEISKRSPTEKESEADARRKDKYEVYEGWFDDGTRMMMCGKTLLHDDLNPYNHGDIPFVTWCTQPKERSLVGYSEMEDIEDLQQAIWVKDNQRIDSVNYSMFGLMIIDPNIPDGKNFKFEPGKVVRAPQGARFEQFRLDPGQHIALAETDSYLAAIDAMTGYNAVLDGSNPGGMDRVTATVGTIADEATTLRRAMKKLQFRLAIAKIAKMWVQLNNQFLSEYELHRILGDSSVDLKPIPVEEIPMFLDVIPEAMNEAMSITQERSANLDLINIIGQLHGMAFADGTVFDAKATIVDLLKSYDREPAPSFPEAPPQPAPEGQIPEMSPTEAPDVRQETGNIAPEQDMGNLKQVME
jgi:hypothetical protein